MVKEISLQYLKNILERMISFNRTRSLPLQEVGKVDVIATPAFQQGEGNYIY